MSLHYLTWRSFFVLLPAFKVGISDTVNPCSFASALIFILYLASVGYTQKRVFLLGFLFIISAAFTHFGLALGFFDPILMTPAIDRLLHLTYSFLGIIFLFLGVRNIQDWWQFRKYSETGCFKCRTPAFLQEAQSENLVGGKKKILVFFEFILLAFVIGVLMTVGGSIYPQNEYIFIVYSFLMAGGDSKVVFLSFLQYSVASVLPLVIVWIAVLFVGMARKKENVVIYYKGISAALFLSVGISLGYFLLR